MQGVVNVDGREAGAVIEGEKAPGRVRERAGEILGNETAGIGRGEEARPTEESDSMVEEVLEDDVEIEETRPPDCPYCDHVLMLWMRPGPNKGKWACAECDKSFTVEGLRRLGR